MCGFAGVIKSPNKISGKAEFLEFLRDMATRIRRRGPDDFGQWCDCDNGVGFAHRRLSILDLSSAGHQPMVSHSGRYIIAYNGEIYNFERIRSQLESKGKISWRGHSDTEVLLEAIEIFGVKRSLELAQGMFAFALWDRKTQKLYLARDRMGEKPLYYGFNNGTFYFGSDLVSFCGDAQWTPETDKDSLRLFLRYGYIPTPYSIYKGIYKLIPGTYVELSVEECLSGNTFAEPIAYWSYPTDQSGACGELSEADLHEKTEILEELITSAINDQQISDVPLGVFLSGGIDSSLITSILCANSKERVKSFSIGFHEKSYNEAEYAQNIARHLGTEHTELYVSASDALQIVPNLAEVYSEPFADISALPTLMLAKLTKESVTVCLSGDAGDELFCGYSRYTRDLARWNKIRAIPPIFRKALAKIIKLTPIQTLEHLLCFGNLFREKDLRNGSLASSVKRFGWELMCDNLKELYDFRLTGGLVEDATVISQTLSSLPFTKKMVGLGSINYMTSLDIHSYLPDDILTKVDRAAMAYSLETRIPFLDHRVVEFAATLPLEYKMHGGELKWPLKQILYKYVPQSIVDRPKKGFGAPIGRWLKEELKDWADWMFGKEMLDLSGVSEILPVESLWQQHLKGHYNHQEILWRILMYQAWYERYEKVSI